MNLESPKISLSKSANEVFDFLSNVKNFEGLMPKNISNFELLEKDKFIFALTGMPEIILQKKIRRSAQQHCFGGCRRKIRLHSKS
jgi:hypothetical protein